jgi:hypothetical protein
MILRLSKTLQCGLLAFSYRLLTELMNDQVDQKWSFHFVVAYLRSISIRDQMWTCPSCKQQFVNNNQSHLCGDKLLSDFLDGKSEHTLSLFWHFVSVYQQLGKVTVHPAKSMIGFAANTRIAYVIKLGKNFMDVVFPFDQPYTDNLCFHKIAQVPGSRQFNHHFRMMNTEDVNEEVISFMKLAYTAGQC